MTLDQFRLLCLSISSNREDSDTIPQLASRTNTALEQIARDTIPLKLIVDNTDSSEILKGIDKDRYIRYPNLITNNTDALDIDRSLLNAAANLVMASVESSRSGIYMKQYWDTIATHEYNLTKDYDYTEEHILQDFTSDEPGYLLEDETWE